MLTAVEAAALANDKKADADDMLQTPDDRRRGGVGLLAPTTT